MKTVGDLKKFIDNLPDNMPLAIYRSDMETSGYRNNLSCKVTNMTKDTKYTWDRFDGTDYSYEVLVPVEYGIPCLMIN